jgi:hypothetical protein
MWYLAPTSASAYVLLLELHSYAHDAMLERRNNFIMFLHLECLFLGRVFTIGLLGNLEALLQKLLAIVLTNSSFCDFILPQSNRE